MNLVTSPLLCLMILVQQTICQNEVFQKLSCDNENIRKYIVDRHNELRAQVNPPSSNMLRLEWNEEAAANAAKWANQCQHCHSKADQRAVPAFGCGENLYMSNRPYNWTKVIQSWWDEYKDFQHGHGAKVENAVVGHYTQLVWYKSFQIGCALGYCPNQSLIYFYVCDYCPAGNEKKSLHVPYETGEKCAKCPHACKDGLCDNPCLHHDEFDNCSEYKDMCDSEEEDMSEEYKIKNICKETCNCDTEIH